MFALINMIENVSDGNLCNFWALYFYSILILFNIVFDVNVNIIFQ